MCSIPRKDKVSDVYTACENLPERFNKPACMGGYGQRKQHPLYRTSQNDYGRLAPNIHTMPTCFYGSNTKFTEGILRFGMYRYHGLNTELDKNAVMEFQPPNFS